MVNQSITSAMIALLMETEMTNKVIIDTLPCGQKFGAGVHTKTPRSSVPIIILLEGAAAMSDRREVLSDLELDYYTSSAVLSS